MGNSDDFFDVVTRFRGLEQAAAFPEIEITTERLLLRAYTEADIDAHVTIFDDDPIHRWSSAPQHYTREHARAWCTGIANDIRMFGDGICWAVEDRETSRLMGMTGLHSTDWRNRTTEISAIGGTWAVGHGFAKEALRAISHWVLVDQQFHRIQISAAIDNRASRRVAESCGFVKEGILRNAGTTRSGQVDLVVYGLTPSDLVLDSVPVYSVEKRVSRPDRSTRITEVVSMP